MAIYGTCPKCGSETIDYSCADCLYKERDEALQRAEAAERFKTFVHGYLDSHGVPHGDPANQHQVEGCRIGARLDLLFAERDALAAEILRLKTLNEQLAERVAGQSDLLTRRAERA